MSKTKPFAIVLVLLGTLIMTIAQILWKIGAANLQPNLISIVTNYYIWGGFIALGFLTLIFIFALRHGEASVLFPLNTASFVWVTIASAYLFNEIVTPFKWIGIFFILLGVSFVGAGGKK